MEITILDSILHGSLKPWHFDFKDTRRVTELLISVNPIKLDRADAPRQILRLLLTDYPTLEKQLIAHPFPDDPSLEYLFAIKTHPMAYPVEQFYEAIIRLECLRLINIFDSKMQQLVHVIDRTYNYKKFIKNIKILAQQTSDEIDFLLSPEHHTENNEQIINILAFLQNYLTLTFFDVQQRYAYWKLDTPISEEFFFTHYLKKTYPGVTFLKKLNPYFQNNLSVLWHKEHFARQDLLDFIELLKQHNPLDKDIFQAAAENFIYFNENNLQNTCKNEYTLTDRQIVKNTITAAKSEFNKQINLLQFGHQRLELTNNFLDDLDYVRPPYQSKTSIPQQLASFYTEQKNIFIQNFNTKFPVYSEESTTAKSVPKTKSIDFEFKGDVYKLKNVLSELNEHISLLDDSRTSVEELLATLTRPIYPNSKKIYLNCETVQFRYIIDKFKPFFNKLSLSQIDASELFYSKNEKVITKGNLSASKIANPKEDRTINNIINQLQ